MSGGAASRRELLQELDPPPERLLRLLLQAGPHELEALLGGPALIHLPGRNSAPLFASVLLHGNEITGWLAVRELLRAAHASGRELPRALSVFVGNVRAAVHGLRMLEGQPDYNRIWKGGDTPEHRMAQQVVDAMRRRGVFASVDIHNNTGRNPHYACLNVLEPAWLHLASLFGRTVVWFLQPDSVQSMAFTRLCPSVTVECGKPGRPQGTAHALEFLSACLRLSRFPKARARDLDVYHTVATVRVPEAVRFCAPGTARGAAVDLRLAVGLDALNFVPAPAGTVLAERENEQGRLEVIAEDGVDRTADFLEVESQQIRTRKPVMPSMFSLDPRIVRQDCLGYFMERVQVENGTPRAEAAGHETEAPAAVSKPMH